MLIDGPACQGPAQLPDKGLLSFALPDRIVGQGYEAFHRKIGCDHLRFGFSLLSVARLQKNRGIAAGLIGPVQVGSDIKARQTLENHFLDRVELIPDTACGSGIQRPVVVGKTAQDFSELFTDKLFPSIRIGDSKDSGNRALALVELLLCDTIHPTEKRVLRRRLSRESPRQTSYKQQRDCRKFHKD